MPITTSTRHIVTVLFTLFVSLFSSHHSIAQATHHTTPDTLIDQLNALAQQHHVAAYAVAVIDPQETTRQHVYGFNDIAANIPATTDSLFRIGSVSKLFVGLSVLTLVDQGLVSLNDDLRTLVPDIAFSNPWHDTHPVRLVHLLEHTSGWQDSSVKEYASNTAGISLKDALMIAPAHRVSRWQPGTRHAYSNTGNAVAAYVVETVTGMAFHEFVQQHFFTPLGMTSATYFEPQPAQAAKAYLKGEPQPYWHIAMAPAGAINATVSDMTQLLQFLINGGTQAGKPLISQIQFQRMLRSETTLGATQGIETGYGITMVIDGHKGLPLYGHNGAVFGAMAELNFSIEYQRGYVLMMTGDQPGYEALSTALKDYITADTVPFPKTGAWDTLNASHPLPETFRALAGWYRPVNVRSERQRYIQSLIGALKVWPNNHMIHTSPLMAGWHTTHYYTGGNALTDVFRDRPTLARVTDPQLGETLQIGADLYQPINLNVMIIRLVLTVAAVIGSILFMSNGFWRLVYLGKKRQLNSYAALLVILPWLGAACLIGIWFLPLSLLNNLAMAAAINPITALVYLCSIGLPLFAIASLVLYLYKGNAVHSLTQRYIGALISALLVFSTIDLALHDMLALALWTQ